MAVKFVIDSASDVLPSEATVLGVTHLPLKVRFGDAEYADAVNLSHKQFYEMLSQSKELPTTSQVTPAEFQEAYEALTKNGDEVVVITISSKLSGTYQSAVIAADEFEGKVFVVDSLNATIGERILLQQGMELANQGMGAAAIAAELDTLKHKIRLFAYLDTLEYLKKGGRISATTAVVGGLLNIKPLIAVQDGAVASVGKARGAKLGNQMLMDLIGKTTGVDRSKPFCVAYSGASDDQMQKFLADSADIWKTAQVPTASVGCVIGTHVGPGAVAVAYFEN